MVFNATFKQYLGYFVAVSSIGGGNRSTRGKRADSFIISSNVACSRYNIAEELRSWC
jgi:hypothetical protein